MRNTPCRINHNGEAILANIYEMYDKAFASVSAFIIITNNTGERIATLAFKRPKDGAGRLYCYFHLLSMPMSRGFAAGGGYGKASAAFLDATEKAKIADGSSPDCLKLLSVVKEAALKGNGSSQYVNALRDAGFNVLQAV